MKSRTTSLVVALLSLCGWTCARGSMAGAPEVVTKPSSAGQRSTDRRPSSPVHEPASGISAAALLPKPEAMRPAREASYDEVFTEDDVGTGAEEPTDGEPGDEASAGADMPSDAVFTEDEVERFADEEAGLPTGVLPLFGAMVLQKVNDYDTWRAAFDDGQPTRQHAGFVAQGVMHGLDDRKLVAVWLSVTDVALAKAYLAGLRLPGAAGRPRIQLSRNVAAHMEPGQEHVAAAVVSVRIDELSAFKGVLEVQNKMRESAGVTGYALGQDIADPGLAYLYLQSPRASSLRVYLSSRLTREGWRDAGANVASVSIVQEDELTLYR
jgi:hypothetical protein